MFRPFVLPTITWKVHRHKPPLSRQGVFTGKMARYESLENVCQQLGHNHTLTVTCTTSAKHLLTPWCRVLLEQLTDLQLVKMFPAFHGTRRFITAFTSVRHLSLSWARPIQSTCPHPTSWRSFLILSTHLCLGLPSGAHYFLVYLFKLLYMFRATMCPSSGELTVSVRHWYFSLCMGGCLVCWLG